MGEAFFVTLPLHQMSHTIGQEQLGWCQRRLQTRPKKTGNDKAVRNHCDAAVLMLHGILYHQIKPSFYAIRGLLEAFSSRHTEQIAQNLLLLIVRLFFDFAGQPSVIFPEGHLPQLIEDHRFVLGVDDAGCHLAPDHGLQ